MRYFRSDDHFFNYNVNKNCDRPFLHTIKGNQIFLNNDLVKTCKNKDEALKESIFLTVQTMNNTFIEKWNRSIQPNDTVYYLGDFAMPCNIDECSKLLKKLNGYKILIRGNHDDKINKMLKIGFNEVHDKLIIEIDNKKVNLSHYPYIAPFMEFLHNIKIPQYNKRKNDDAEIIWNKIYELNHDLNIGNFLKDISNNNKKIEFLKELFEANIHYVHKDLNNFRNRIFNVLIGTKLKNDDNFLIHGHTHSKTKIVNKMINVCSDAWDYECVSEDQIIELMRNYEK